MVVTSGLFNLAKVDTDKIPSRLNSKWNSSQVLSLETHLLGSQLEEKYSDKLLALYSETPIQDPSDEPEANDIRSPKPEGRLRPEARSRRQKMGTKRMRRDSESGTRNGTSFNSTGRTLSTFPRNRVNGASVNLNTQTTSHSVRLAITPTDDGVRKLTCTISKSCKNRCQRERDPGPTKEASVMCFCDQFCEQFEDCCADYDDYCAPLNLTSTVFSETWQCGILREQKMSERLYFRGIWMISLCPKSWPQDAVRSKCVASPYSVLPDYKDGIPVVSSNGTTYRNRYCAKCNGEHMEELSEYDLHESCFAGHEDLRKCPNEIGQLSCVPLAWKPFDGVHRRYCPALESKCQTGSSDLRKKCETGSVRLVFGLNQKGARVNYKNRFCAQCHGAKLLLCGPGLPVNLHQLEKPGYSAIFNINRNPVTRILPSTLNPVAISGKCPEGQVYDLILKTCRQALMSQSTTPTMKRYRVVLWIELKTRYFTKSTIHTEERSIKESLVSTFGIQPFHLSNMRLYAREEFVLVALDVDFLFKRKQGDNRLNVDRMLNFTRPFSMKINNRTYNVYKGTARLLVCVRLEEFTSREYTFLPLDQPAVYINGSREIFYKNQYYANTTTWEDCKVRPVGTISVCRLFLTANCSGSYIPLERHEYTVFSNGTLYRNISGETFEFGTYDTRNNTTWICTNYTSVFDNLQEREKYKASNDLVLVILTHIGLSLSVLCLVVTLITFCLFSELRTLPGMNLMNLSASLLLQQSLYFLTGQTETRVGCSIIAVLIHYFILTSFFWMSIIAFDTWRALSRVEVVHAVASRASKRKRLLMFMVLGWLLPLAFIIIPVALDLSEVFVVGYGGPSACLITDNVANIVFLYTPIALSIVFNAIFFIMTACAIHKTKQQTLAVAGNQHNRRTFPVFLRMAVLMGFTWIFGFLGMLISEYLFYPFTILSTLQGVYIAAAFVFRRQVMKLYGKLLGS